MQRASNVSNIGNYGGGDDGKIFFTKSALASISDSINTNNVSLHCCHWCLEVGAPELYIKLPNTAIGAPKM